MKRTSALVRGAAALLVALPAVAQEPARPTTAAITAADAMTRVYALAADSMMGREAGTRGNLMATDYLAREAERLGLHPAGEDGTFFQTVPLVRKALDQGASLAAGSQPLTPFQDFAPLPHVPGLLNVGQRLRLAGAPVVYGGRWGAADAITPAQAEGKFVVFAPPVGPNGQPVWQVWALGPMDRYPAAAGIAIASLDISPPGLVEFIRTPQEGVRRPPPPAGAAPAMVVTRDAAERLLGRPLDGAAPGATGGTVTGEYAFTERPVAHPARNVVAVLPGSDPLLRGQYVAVGAHSDHVGIGDAVDHDSLRAAHRLFRPLGADQPEPRLTPEQSARVRAVRDSLGRSGPARADSIFNGADDDASGTAGVLEIAEYFAAQETRPRRSLLFVWHTAEEKGLLGSEYFVENATVPRDSIVAQLNIDMIGRGRADDRVGTTREGALISGGPGYVQLVGSRRLSRALGDLVEEVNRTGGHDLRFDYSIDADRHPAQIYCRSDHYHYARFGIPVTFFTTGLHADYHQVTDEPQYLDYEHLAAVTRLIADVAGAIANADAPPALDGPRPDPHGQCRQ